MGFSCPEIPQDLEKTASPAGNQEIQLPSVVNAALRSWLRLTVPLFPGKR